MTTPSTPCSFIEAAWEQIPDFRETYEVPDGMLREHVPAYDQVVVRELLVNSIVHRPYSMSATSSSDFTRIAWK